MFFRHKSRVTPFLNKTSINYLAIQEQKRREEMKIKESEMDEKYAHGISFAFCEFNTVILILCDNIQILAEKKNNSFLCSFIVK